MSFARPWWLVALALLLPLVLLHLRRPALAVRDVANLAIWDRLAGPGGVRGLASAPPAPPRAAGPAGARAERARARARGPRAPGRGAARDDRLRRRRLALDARRHAPRGRPRGRPAAGGGRAAQPRRRRDCHGHARGRLSRPSERTRGGVAARARESLARATSRRASRSARVCSAVAAGAWSSSARPRPRSREIRAAPGQVSVRVVGSPTADQGVFARGSRCGIGPAGACEILATVRNESASPRVDRYVAHVDGKPVLTAARRGAGARREDACPDRSAGSRGAAAADRARRARARRHRLVRRPERGRHSRCHDRHAGRRPRHRQAARAGSGGGVRGDAQPAHARDVPPARRARERPRRARAAGSRPAACRRRPPSCWSLPRGSPAAP